MSHLGTSETGPEAVPAMMSRSSFGAALETHFANFFAEYGSSLPPDGLYNRVLEEMERPLLLTTMAAVSGNQLRAARLLGINRNTLRKKLSDLNIDPGAARRK
jgi:two-component system, NtrC family, nitrogen regulation response regulator GlnG